jgi:diaminohydroxyphosphoribosylaminopyrimidine deaminase/5-amino-6-(5-phosphoribosylamino)uracil reductase
MSNQEVSGDAAWMSRAIALAAAGRGDVEPNPMVGCVIVRDGKVLGEGRHEYFGAPHAEPNALAACTVSPVGATAYVNLEPCCHTQKKTPPCVPALINAKISRVVVGCLDPNPQVAALGIEQLRAAGVAVGTNILEAEAKQLNAAYFARLLHQRPYVTLKWAESSDGKVAAPFGGRAAISNKTSLSVVHAMRARCDAILVGIKTALNDDPLLTARGIPTTRPSVRIVLDPELRLPPESQLAKTAHLGPVIVYCTQRTYQTRSLAVAGLRSRRLDVVALPSLPGEESRISLGDLMLDLNQRQVTNLLVEPGPGLARAFFDANLADRVWRFRSPKAIGHESAPAAEVIPYPRVAEINLDTDVLEEYLNPDGAVFFAPEASADYLRVREKMRGFPRPAG